MIRRARVFVMVAFLGLFVVAIGAATAAPGVGTAASVSAADCGGNCQSCGLFETRLITWPGEWWHYPYGCTQISCPNGCAQTLTSADGTPLEDSVAELERLVAEGNSREIAALLVNDPRVEFNYARSLIQVIGCDDAVVASFGLNPAFVGRLLAE